MSNSTSLLDLVSQGQADKEGTANAVLNAESPGSFFANRATTTGGLTWGFYGGFILVGGVLTAVANGTVALTASLTNYVEIDTVTGAVSANTTAFTPGRIPLYSIVCGASTITSYTDYRSALQPFAATDGLLTLAMADANKTLTSAQASNRILQLTGALTALRDVIVPLVTRQWTVFANVTGGFGIRVIGASGTGITVADGKRAIVYADGTNIVRVTADT